ncbi:CocE/NonD family hydrolase [Spirillospora sp. CA-294931]|uniref:CocE/NonD family hydrolase n=1 Tax=Spirillospora sp. CA-294931 TaxID=3240042 RepID=UPI003D8FC9CF
MGSRAGRYRALMGAGLAAILVFSLSAARQTGVDAGQAGPCAVTVQKDVPDRMRDGTILSADVYRPKAKEKVPVVLMRTQYGKSGPPNAPHRFISPFWLASQCYLVVVEDVRGQYASKGTFYEFEQDQNDGYDSVEWAARLPGSNGRVGMYGSSYVGAVQWLAAGKLPPHLVTIVPFNTSSDYYEGWTYEGGQFRLGFIEPWAAHTIVHSAAVNRGDTALAKELETVSLDIGKWMAHRPYRTFPPFRPDDPKVAPYFFDWIKHSTNDAYWKRWAPERYHSKLKIPVLHFEGWYDSFLDGGIRNFTGMVERGGSPQARAGQRLVIGPWDHNSWAFPPCCGPSPMLKAIGPVGNSPADRVMLAWFDHYLKGRSNGVSNGRPTVDYFEMGSNVWRRAGGWPVPGTRFTKYYLSSGGHAATLLGDGQLTTRPPDRVQPPDAYTYDPRNPVPSLGGHSCCDSLGGQQGMFDQQPIEQRPDVLVYTSPELTADTHVTGPISVDLYASSSAKDTDWTAKLVDVHPDDTAANLNNGILRASFRASSSKPTPIVPGKIYKYTIKIWPTSNLYKAGHRIRLEISSSDYPQYAPNPNTGEPFGASDRQRVAHQKIYHDPAHPSSVTLPLIPADKVGPAYQRVPTEGLR